jgi:hypothetical protein
MAVADLESLGILFIDAESLKIVVPNIDILVMAFGEGSAVIDNLPLVADRMRMFNEPMDNHL